MVGFGILVVLLEMDNFLVLFKMVGWVWFIGCNIDFEDGVYLVVIEVKDRVGVVVCGLLNIFIVDSSFFEIIYV